MKKLFYLLLITGIFLTAICNVISVSAATIVNVSTVTELQSSHPYTNNMDQTWIYTHPTAADSLKITFSSDTATESNYDYIYILDGSGNQIGKYSGTTLAGKTLTIFGNVVKIRLTSDVSNTASGFTVTSITENTVATPPSTSSGFSSGSGTSSSPYIISSVGDMYYFKEQLLAGYTFLGEYVKLNTDVNLTDYPWNITTQEIFEGTFLGNNKTITVNSNFLGKIGESGTVDWLNVTSTEILTTPLLCLRNSGTIQNCRVKGDVLNDPGHAGLLCEYNYGNVYNSCGFGSLEGHGDDSNCYVGWIVFNTGTIKNCYTVVELSGDAPGKYNSFYKHGITPDNDGLVGNCYTGTEVVQNSQNFVDSLNQMETVSGYIWTIDSGNTNNGYPVITKCLDAKTQVSYSSDAMFVFHTSSITTSITSTVSGCTIYYTLDGTNPTTSSTRRIYSAPISFSSDFEIRTTAYKNGSYSVPTVQYGIKLYGSGTSTSPYQIRSNLGLYAIRYAADKAYSLEADLDFTNDEYLAEGAPNGEWIPIPSFTGVLDGKSHSITGIASTHGGLLDSNGGTVKNLRLLNHRLCNRNGEYFGAVSNRNDGTITRCYVSGGATSYCTFAYLGGIAGWNTGTISYCQTSGTLTTDSPVRYSHMRMGGIAGYSTTTIYSCVSDMDISTCNSNHDLGCNLGGIVGYGKATNCRFDGSLYAQVAGAKFSIASASGEYDGSYCYNGGADIYYNTYISVYFPQCSYRSTDTIDSLEASFPMFDFNTTWMITEDGPMPQGVMNADGTYYTKKSYTAPTCNADGKAVYTDQYGNTISRILPQYPHSLSEGICTNSGCNYKEVYRIALQCDGEAVSDGVELDKNRTYLFTAVITPSDAIDQTITWTSSDTSVAIVSENGYVSAVGTGACTISATASNQVQASVGITVIESPYLNKIKGSDNTAVVGDKEVKTEFYMATDKNVNFIYCILRYPDSIKLQEVVAKDFAIVELEDEYTEGGYTTVVLNGLYSETENITKYHTFIPFELTFDVSKAGVPGVVQIEVTEESCLIGNDTYFFEERIAGKLEITPKLVESIEISGADVISDATLYTATVTPDYASNKEVEWSVDNLEVATVDELGMVTPVTAGIFTLTATAKDGSGVFATKTVEIIRLAESIEIVGEEEITEPSQYTVIILPEYTTNQDVQWVVSDETIATVSENGLVTPLKNGKIVLTATAKDASGIETTKSVVITVSVRANSITSDVGEWDCDFDSDITEYTIYVPEATSVLYLTSSFTDATAKVNGSIAANGMRKKIALSSAETEVEIVLTPVSGNSLKANTYTVKIIRGACTKTTVSGDGAAFTVTPLHTEIGKTVILALYDGCKLVEMQPATYEGEALFFTTQKSYTGAKVMVWESLNSLSSVCSAELIQ